MSLELMPRVSDRRVPPHNPTAETSILGAVMLRNNALDAVGDLRADDFYDPRHEVVFTAMLALRARGIAIDPTTLEEEVARTGKLAPIGGLAFLSELVTVVPTADNVRFYADIVRDKATARALIATASEIAAKGFTEYGDALDYVTESQRAIEGVASRMPSGSEKSARDVAVETTKRIAERASAAPEQILGRVPTGYRDVDARIGGLPIGVLAALGGVRRFGKSSIARGFVIGACEVGRIGAHVFSQEDTDDVWGDRLRADMSGIPLEVIRRGKNLDGSPLDRETWQALHRAAEREAAMRYIVDTDNGLSAAQIRARVVAKKRALGTKLVVVDYLQEMGTPSTRDFDARRATRTEKLGVQVKGLAQMAREEQVAVLLLVQVASEVEKEMRAPLLGDIRECGDVANVARLVMFLNRVWERRNGKPTGRLTNLAELCIAKNSNGPADTVDELEFVPEIASYRNRYAGGAT